MMVWSHELHGMLSDRGYSITRVRMATGWWHNAYTPKGRGVPIATGSLERCMLACETHFAGETRGKGKRQFRPERQRIRKSHNTLAVA